MKKNQISNFLSDTIAYKTDTFFVNKRVPYENQRTYNSTLLYKSIWKDLFAGSISTELTNGLITTPPHTLAPDKLYPYVWSGGFSSEPLSIPDNIIQHVRVNIEINIPDEMIIAPSVLTWERDASFQYHGLYINDTLVYRGRYINPNGLMLFWNPLWSQEEWKNDVPYGDNNPYPYFLSKISLPCYFRLEDNGDVSMLDFQVIPGTGGFGIYFDLQEDNVGQSVWTIGRSGMLYDWLIYDGHSITTGEWQKHPRFIRMARLAGDIVPLEADYVPIDSYIGCPVGSPLIDSPMLAEYVDSATPEWTFSPLTWNTEEFDEMKDIWFHTKPYTQICPQETSYSFRKLSNNKWQIVGHVRICVAQPSTHKVGQALDGDEAPMLYKAAPPDTIKPQIRVTASLCSPDNVTTGYIRNQS